MFRRFRRCRWSPCRTTGNDRPTAARSIGNEPQVSYHLQLRIFLDVGDRLDRRRDVPLCDVAQCRVHSPAAGTDGPRFDRLQTSRRRSSLSELAVERRRRNKPGCSAITRTSSDAGWPRPGSVHFRCRAPIETRPKNRTRTEQPAFPPALPGEMSPRMVRG